MPSSSVASQVREITIAHSPDSDDAFMFYGLATNKVRVPGLKFTHTLTDIETLNRKAMEGVYDVTAISFHAYPYLQDQYALSEDQTVTQFIAVCKSLGGGWEGFAPPPPPRAPMPAIVAAGADALSQRPGPLDRPAGSP